MPTYQPRNAAALWLLLFCAAVRSESRDLRLSDHGVKQEKDTGAASPAMLAFFAGRPEVALPEASDADDPAWAGAGRVAAVGGRGSGHARTALLAAGVVCGVVGAALLAAAAAAAFVVHARRSKPGAGSGPGISSLVRRRSSPEARLGGA